MKLNKKKVREFQNELFKEAWDKRYPPGKCIPDDPDVIAQEFFFKGWDEALSVAIALVDTSFEKAKGDLEHFGGVANSKLNVHRMWGEGSEE